MRAIIALATTDLEGRFERALPPEHRIRARRVCATDDRFIEFIVEGPLLPFVEDGQYRHGDIDLTMKQDPDSDDIVLEAVFRILRTSTLGMEISDKWVVGRWGSYASMMDAMR